MADLDDPRRKLPSPEMIAELYAQGLDYDDIAALYAVTRFGVYAAMKRAGIKVRGTRRPEARFWPKVDKHGPVPDYAPHLGPCWIWTGAQDGHGYGHFRGPEGATVKAYRMAYELVVGPVPDGLQLDHLCRVPLCVNAFHLEPVEQRENIDRGVGASAINSRREVCANGHRYTVENTRIKPNGGRRCITCDRAARARSRAKTDANHTVAAFIAGGA